MSSAPSESRHARRSRMSLFASERSLNDQVWKGYERIVGFDTMPDAEDSVSCNATYTLQVKAKGYARTKHTRTFMCAVDATESRCVRQTDAANARSSGSCTTLWTMAMRSWQCVCSTGSRTVRAGCLHRCRSGKGTHWRPQSAFVDRGAERGVRCRPQDLRHGRVPDRPHQANDP